MNDLINEFYDEASDQFKIGQEQGWPTQLQTKRFAEKLAELIIRECSRVCKDYIEDPDETEGRLGCAEDIMAYWGVEE